MEVSLRPEPRETPCTQRTVTELKWKDDKTFKPPRRKGRAFRLKTRESINNVEGKTPTVPDTRGASIVLGLRDKL